MIALVGCSGSGKSTIVNYLFNNHGYKKIVSYTTRPPRYREKDGVDYHFIDKETFLKKKDENFFAETAEYRGWYYGTASEDCKDNTVGIFTPHGLRQIKKVSGLHVISFLISVPRNERLIKILERGDDVEEAKRRDSSDVGQFDGIEDEVDFVVENPGYKIKPEHLAQYIDYDYKKIFNLRTANKKLTILCDIDEVINDLIAQILLRYNEKYKDALCVDDITEYNVDLFTKPECENIFKEFCNEELISNLNPTDGAVETVTELMKRHNFYFVTSTFPDNVSSKNKWLKRHFPLYTEKMLIVTLDKSIIKGDVMIDDYENNLHDGVGLNILLDRPWNRKQINTKHKRAYSWDDVLKYINKYGG